MPPRWASSSRAVIGHSFCGNAGQYFWTGASRFSLPRSQSCKMAVAVIGLEMDPSRNNVDGVTGAKSSRSAMPNPADQTGSPSRTAETAIPGTLFADMKLETAFSMASRLPGERLFGSAESDEAQVRNKEIRQTTCVQKRLALASLALVFTGSPPPRVYPKPWTPGTAPGRALVCSESVTPHSRECVDLLAGGSLP